MEKISLMTYLMLKKNKNKIKCIHWENKTSCTLVARAIQNISMSAQMSELI